MYYIPLNSMTTRRMNFEEEEEEEVIFHKFPVFLFFKFHDHFFHVHFSQAASLSFPSLTSFSQFSGTKYIFLKMRSIKITSLDLVGCFRATLPTLPTLPFQPPLHYTPSFFVSHPLHKCICPQLKT